MQSKSVGNKVYLIAVALVIGLLFSVGWIYPLSVQKLSDEPDSFVPIRYGFNTGTGDSYFYYSHIRESIDSKGLSTDPITLEHKETITPHITYSVSLWVAALGAFFTEQTEHAYYFNQFVFPLLNFCLVFLLIFSFTRQWNLAVFLAVLCIIVVFPHRFMINPKSIFTFLDLIVKGVTVDSQNLPLVNLLARNQLTRTPNILLTNVHLLLSVWTFYQWFYKANKSKKTLIFTLLVLSITPLIAVTNFFIVFSIFFLLFLFYLKDNGNLKLTLVLGGFAAIIGILGLALMWEVNEITKQATGYGSMHQGNWFRLVYSLYLFSPLILFSFFPFSGKKFILVSILGMLGVYLVFFAVGGHHMAFEFEHRGYGVLLSTLSFVGGVNIVAHIVSNRSIKVETFGRILLVFPLPKALSTTMLTRWWSVGRKAVIPAMTIGILVVYLFNQFQIAMAESPAKNDADFKELYRWCVANTDSDEVALTLDSDLIVNLPVYTPLNMYIPQAILSYTPHEERYQRFLETMRFMGYSQKQFAGFLKNHGNNLLEGSKSIERIKSDRALEQTNLLELALFYFKNRYLPMSKEDESDLIEKYKKLNEMPLRLSYKADYLIVSTYSEQFLHQKSKAKDLINRSNPVFENSSYRVYRI